MFAASTAGDGRHRLLLPWGEVTDSGKTASAARRRRWQKIAHRDRGVRRVERGEGYTGANEPNNRRPLAQPLAPPRLRQAVGGADDLGVRLAGHAHGAAVHGGAG